MKPETLKKIQAASKRRREANQCTSETPMPKDSDSLWFHPDAKRKEGEPIPSKVGDSSIFICPNCGLEFKTTLRSL